VKQCETDDRSLVEAVELPKRVKMADAQHAKNGLRQMGHRHGHRTGLGRLGEGAGGGRIG
jgi:hypothetical protein